MDGTGPVFKDSCMTPRRSVRSSAASTLADRDQQRNLVLPQTPLSDLSAAARQTLANIIRQSCYRTPACNPVRARDTATGIPVQKHS